MKEYDLVVIGTGSSLNIMWPQIQRNPDLKVALIEKDRPGGICLTRGCIPTTFLGLCKECVISSMRILTVLKRA
jgi:dihydrolipoamide dehydrogenase